MKVIKTTVIREKFLPIVNITASGENNLFPVVLTAILSCIEIAERFNGRLLEKEKRPSMHEKDIVATAQVIFKNENDLSEFIREVKKRQS